ncbi:MAG TPA: phospho-sugar mutase [Kosmotogaceae bacterium]|nr:MAG: Glucose-1,6-bisphosphate synthase [Thermotogales bacterium 46_20]HAA85486.1 phospho-sugar mutase [Kosmotogaceae bacterium]
MRTSDEVRNEYKRWLEKSSHEAVEELKNLSPEEVTERFFQDLEFGTGGMRGKIGMGTNRMNIYTITRASRGFARWMNEKYHAPSVAIAHDTRHKSEVFENRAATVFAASGVTVHIFDFPAATPLLSYAVRELGCSGGVVITASHNPKEYNGFKVYTSDGTQAVPAIAEEITALVKESDFFMDLPEKSEEARKIPLDLVEAYRKTVIDLARAVRDIDEKVKVIYTPLHGTGKYLVPDVLRQLGHVVIEEPSQSIPDSDFPTVSYPNPEDRSTYALALELAQPENADLIISTDPDCDRMGIMARSDEEYVFLTGNQIGIMLTEFLLGELSTRLPPNPFIIKTIVSSDMAAAIAREYGVTVKETLTGFKFIGELIEESEKTNSGSFIFGFEESYGYLYGTHVRDKDAVVSSALITLLYSKLKSEGLSIPEYLEMLYDQYGYYSERLVSKEYDGIEGIRKIENIMARMRDNPPRSIGENKLEKTLDYLEGIEGLPASNVVSAIYEGDLKLIVRPSGTEPKIKFYLMASGESKEVAERKLDLLEDEVERIVG